MQTFSIGGGKSAFGTLAARAGILLVSVHLFHCTTNIPQAGAEVVPDGPSHHCAGAVAGTAPVTSIYHLSPCRRGQADRQWGCWVQPGSGSSSGGSGGPGRQQYRSFGVLTTGRTAAKAAVVSPTRRRRTSPARPARISHVSAGRSGDVRCGVATTATPQVLLPRSPERDGVAWCRCRTGECRCRAGECRCSAGECRCRAGDCRGAARSVKALWDGHCVAGTLPAGRQGTPEGCIGGRPESQSKLGVSASHELHLESA